MELTTSAIVRRATLCGTAKSLLGRRNAISARANRMRCGEAKQMLSEQDSNTIRRIQRAFSNVNFPPLSEIVHGNAWQDDEILDWLKERGAQVDDSFIEAFSDCLPNFTRAGIVYFLPRYMTYSIIHSNTRVMDYIVSKIANLASSGCVLSDFSEEQRSAVRSFLVCAQHWYGLVGGPRYLEIIQSQLSKGSVW